MERTKILFLVFQITLTSLCWIQATGQRRTRPSTDVQPNVVYFITQNFTAGSVYERNANEAITKAIQSPTLDQKVTKVGTEGNIVYSTAECYIDNTCGRCLNASIAGFRSVAPQSIGGQMFLNVTDYSCYLRFEPYDFSAPPAAPAPGSSGSPSPEPSSRVYTTSQAPANPDQFLEPRSSATTFSVGIIIGILVGVLGSSTIGIGLLIYCIRRHKLLHRRRRRFLDTDDLPDIQGSTKFVYRDLEAATHGFNESNKLGQGAFGSVYKGTLKDGTLVAVKQLDHHSKQGQREFLNEIRIITNIKHKNLVCLKGYCIDEDDRLLVYEYLPNKSLDRALFGAFQENEDFSIFLDWPARMQIISGIASGLTYLHEESQQGIIHRDIKASNILLDEKLRPKISDFGISKLFNQDQDVTNTIIAGTFGYLAPEYLQGGQLSTKADVYSFGILALEIVSGRKCIIPGKEQLLLLVWMLNSDGKMKDIVDKKLDFLEHYEEISRVIKIALACTAADPDRRPTMKEVVAMLDGYREVTIPPADPHHSMHSSSNFKPFSDTSTMVTSSASSTWTQESSKSCLLNRLES